MFAFGRRIWPAALSRRFGPRTRIAIVASAGVHVCAVAVLALVDFAPPPVPEPQVTVADVVAPIESAPLLANATLTVEPTADSVEGGSRFNAPDSVLTIGGAPVSMAVSPFIGAGIDIASLESGALGLGEKVAPLGGGGGGGSHGSGEGNGIGDGVGDGTGTAFFGLAAQGRSFVFVVDASSSMRRPSHGPERTLFNKVKLEIVESLRQMTEQQKFYIVFFNDRFLAMPATSLVAATEDSQARYLRWMSEVPSGGQTDPEGAMQLALQLEPDVIYFLSDGEFKYGLVKRIAAMNRTGVTIHTVCFGGLEDKNVSLRQIAEQNSGTYRFVPLPAPPQETAVNTPKTSASSIP